MPPTEAPVVGSNDVSSGAAASRAPLFTSIGAVLVLVALGALYWFTPLFSGTQKVEEPLTVGVIQYVKHLDPVVEGFKQGLTELGYEEGVDIVYEYQSADGDAAKAKQFALGYLEKDVDLILTITSAALEPAWQATQEVGKNTPIVFTNGPGIVESGLADSYQSSGKNFTGVVPDDIEVTLKKLEFMKQIQPEATKVGVFFGSPTPPGATTEAIKALREQAPKLGLTLVEYPIMAPPPQSPAAVQKIADGIKMGEVDAFVTIPDGTSSYQDNPLIQIALSKRIKAPIYFLTVPRVFQGGLLSYSQDYTESGKRAAAMADKIFKGTDPKDIPIEASKKNLLIINLKTAKEMGLTIPDSLLFVADQVIPADEAGAQVE
jgi:putative tryptophan/tyrosine transport system substrate-binding protein